VLAIVLGRGVSQSTPEQITLADAAALSFAENQHVDLDPLLDSLYCDLRSLLGMKPETRSRIVFSVQPGVAGRSPGGSAVPSDTRATTGVIPAFRCA
jgi:hypothetical protein